MIIIAADGKVVIDVILDDGTVAKGVANIDGKLGGLGTVAQKSAKSIGDIVSALGLVALARKGIDMVKSSLEGAIARFDTLNRFPRVMQMIGFDSEQSEKAISKLSDGVQGLPTKLESVASTAQNIAVMTKDLDGAVDTTLALNNAFLASGASTNDAERGLHQYVQMLAKGEVDLQSWHTLQETMGVALNQLAEDFGFAGESAQNDLYDALKKGHITFDEFNEKLIEASERQGGFADMAQEGSEGIATSWGNIKQAVVVGVTGILQEIDKLLGGTGKAEDGFEGIVKILETVKGSIYTVFGWITKQIPKAADAFSTLKENTTKFFSKFGDIVRDAKKGVSDLAEVAKPLIDRFKQTTSTLKEQLSPTLDNIKNLFDSLKPILEITGVIVGGIFVAYLITATSVLSGLWRAIGPLINALINFADVVVNVANSIIAILTGDFEAAWQFWRDAGESSVEFFKNLWDGIVGFIQGIVETVIGWFEFLYDILVGNSIIPDLVDAIINWFGRLLVALIKKAAEIVTNVIKKFTELKDDAIKKVKELLFGVKTTFNDIKKAIKKRMTDAVKEVGRKVGEMPGKVVEKATEMATAGKDLVKGLIKGISGMGKDAIEAITGVVGGVIGKAKSLLKISSPSKLFEQFGEWTGEGLVGGISSMVKQAKKASQKLSEGVASGYDAELTLPSLDSIRGLTANSLIGSVASMSMPTIGIIQQQNNRQEINNRVVIEPSAIYMDGREVGYVVWKPVKEHIDRDKEVKSRFEGVMA